MLNIQYYFCLIYAGRLNESVMKQYTIHPKTLTPRWDLRWWVNLLKEVQSSIRKALSSAFSGLDRRDKGHLLKYSLLPPQQDSSYTVHCPSPSVSKSYIPGIIAILNIHPWPLADSARPRSALFSSAHQWSPRLHETFHNGSCSTVLQGPSGCHGLWIN